MLPARCVGSRSNFHKTTLWRPNGGKAIVYVDLRFHSRDVLCTLSRHFVLPGFRFFCVRLAVHFLAIYSVFRELKKAKFNDNGSKYYAGCLSVRHDSLFISLPSFIKGHKTKREIATFCIFERTWTVRQTKGLMSRTIAVHVRFESWYNSLPSSNSSNRIYNKILDRDWFSVRLFVT